MSVYRHWCVSCLCRLLIRSACLPSTPGRSRAWTCRGNPTWWPLPLPTVSHTFPRLHTYLTQTHCNVTVCVCVCPCSPGSVKVFDYLSKRELTTSRFNLGGTAVRWAPPLVSLNIYHATTHDVYSQNTDLMLAFRSTRVEVYWWRALRMVWSGYWRCSTLRGWMRSAGTAAKEMPGWTSNRPSNPIMPQSLLLLMSEMERS